MFELLQEPDPKKHYLKLWRRGYWTVNVGMGFGVLLIIGYMCNYPPMLFAGPLFIPVCGALLFCMVVGSLVHNHAAHALDKLR